MQPDIDSHDIPSGDGDRPATRPRATGHSRWSSPVSAALEWELTGDVLVVRLAGEVCTWSARQIEPMLSAMTTSLDPGAIHIDLSTVTFFDARGVSLLVGVRGWAVEHHRPWKIVATSDMSGRVLALCGFDVADVLGTPS
jgi:anti-anti-sigma factor